MLKKIGNVFYVFVCAVLIFQLTGCGTIMYPERKGQKGGRIDVGIAVLDGIGLLLFIIPGVIAYAADFSNGTIYLPGTDRSSLDLKKMKQVKFDPKHSSFASIEEIVKKETGYDVKLYQDYVQVSELDSTDEMMVRFAEVLPALQDTRVTLLRK